MANPVTARAKVRAILAADGAAFELAGITNVKPLHDRDFDIRAAGRLNRL